MKTYDHLKATPEQREMAKQRNLERVKEFINANWKGRGSFVSALKESMKLTFIKAYEGNKPCAIKAKCLDCSCFSKEEVTLCEAYTCPLWEIRPYQRKS